MPFHTPLYLQLKVWVSLMLQFMCRGMESLHSITKDAIQFETFNGEQFLYLRDSETKNHKLDPKFKPSNEAKIFKTDGKECTYNLVKLYLSKLNPKNNENFCSVDCFVLIIPNTYIFC